MGLYELGATTPPAVPMMSNPERDRLARSGDLRFLSTPAMIPARPPKSPAGASSVQVHRAISAVANRTNLGDDDVLGGFSLKGLVKGIGNAAKAVAKPALSVAAAVGVPGASIASGLVNRPAPAPAPEPLPAPVMTVAAPPTAAPVVRAARPAPRKPVPTKAAPPRRAPVKVAPDAHVKPGPTKPVLLTKTEATTMNALQKDIADLKAGASTAQKAHDAAQAAKKQSITLSDRAKKLAANAKSIAAKAAKAAEAGDAVGASKLAEQARTIQSVAQNTASMAETASDYSQRAGNAVAAGTDAALIAAATNSETAGGIFAKIQANPLPWAAGALGLGVVGYLVTRKKGRAA